MNGDYGRDNRNYERGGYRGGHGGRGGRDRSHHHDDRRGVPLAELDAALTDVSRRVIGCAINVHRALGPGFAEEVYANALMAELAAEGIAHKAGHAIPVTYKDKPVGQTVADLFVDDRFIVEVMARCGEIGSAERSALRAQLRAADLELGLIINFGERRLKDGLVRVLNPDKLNALRDEEEGEEDEYEDEDEGRS